MIKINITLYKYIYILTYILYIHIHNNSVIMKSCHGWSVDPCRIITPSPLLEHRPMMLAGPQRDLFFAFSSRTALRCAATSWWCPSARTSACFHYKSTNNYVKFADLFNLQVYKPCFPTGSNVPQNFLFRTRNRYFLTP